MGASKSSTLAMPMLGKCIGFHVLAMLLGLVCKLQLWLKSMIVTQEWFACNWNAWMLRPYWQLWLCPVPSSINSICLQCLSNSWYEVSCRETYKISRCNGAHVWLADVHAKLTDVSIIRAYAHMMCMCICLVKWHGEAHAWQCIAMPVHTNDYWT